MSNHSVSPYVATFILMVAMQPSWAAGFSSGSSGVDGAFSPTSDTTVNLPASGVLNYTTVNIPSGVTVRFAQSVKAPVVMLASGDVTIAGTIDISGTSSVNTGPGTLLNQGGLGGPGGYDGGQGGLLVNTASGAGYGPGGGGGGIYHSSQCSGWTQGGGGGGFSVAGSGSYCVAQYGYVANTRTGFGGPRYGSATLLPLVGGSGGGGGAGSPLQNGGPGSGGGGGGGALLLVSSGKITLSGSILAKGGNSGNNNITGCTHNQSNGGAGGAGAGGAVRILASAFTGNGTVNVAGGTGACAGYWVGGGNGAPGYAAIDVVAGGTFSLSTLPNLFFTSIGGVAVPPNPTGRGDVEIPNTVTNPVTVNIAASGIPLGTVVKVILNQPYGENITADSSPLTGTTQSSTASASINIPIGSTVMMASTTYTLTLAMGDAMSIYAKGERVEKVRLSAVIGSQPMATLITISGKEYEVPHAALAMVGG